MNDNWKNSKSLGHDDESKIEFSKEMLAGEPTAIIHFDRIQKHPEKGYIIFEYLLCDESQKMRPYMSHPNQQWSKDAEKFLALWRVTCDFNATLYLVNYAKKGTRYEDEILLIKVLEMNENGITKEVSKRYTRSEFSNVFQRFNRECLADKNRILEDIYRTRPVMEMGNIVLREGEYKEYKMEEIYRIDKEYLEWLKDSDYQYSSAAKIYLEQREDELGRR